ncbi:MAG: phosphatase PAP2 family protein [Myxococcota bacterium]
MAIRAMTVLASVVSALFRGWLVHLRRHRTKYLIAAVLLGVLTIFTVPRDPSWVDWISADQQRHLNWSTALSHWGDFRGTLTVAAALIVAAAVFRRMGLARFGLAIVLAAALSGAAANVGRVTFGRPRPVSTKPDGLYGPTFKYKLQGFPSAHSATAAATSSVLLAWNPWVGAAASVATLAVMWSRIHLRRHHPTDVMVGAFIGVVFGLGLGVAARDSGGMTLPGASREEGDHRRVG